MHTTDKVMRVICPHCGKRESFTQFRWRCDCGEAWEPVNDVDFKPEKIEKTCDSIWRYQDLLDLHITQTPIGLSAGWTPLLDTEINGREVLLKLEYLNPTGSFKDRGTEVMVNILHALGIKEVVEDSSGNAGASLAAYAARVGIGATIYAPEKASPAKLQQIEIYGAQTQRIPGARVKATEAVLKVVRQGAAYASHAYHPGYLLGQQTIAWEVWEQLGGRAPDFWVTPLGQGGHFLGIYLGFEKLLQAGLIDHLPRLVAVQSAAMAPIQMAYEKNLSELPQVNPDVSTVAEGVVVSHPVRWKRIVDALKKSKGICLVYEDEKILAAQSGLAKKGFYVEPTSALAIAALDDLREMTKPADIVVVSLTGNGLKTSLIN
jgi:threonine synthase